MDGSEAKVTKSGLAAGCLILLLFLGPSTAALPSPGSSEASGGVFAAYGTLIGVDPLGLELSALGAVDPGAWTAARDEAGLCWVRCAPKVLGALDPRSGRLAARVTLPYRVYNHVAAENGLIYVTHHTLTRDGFGPLNSDR